MPTHLAFAERYAFIGCPQYGHFTFSRSVFTILTTSKAILHELLQIFHCFFKLLFWHILGFSFSPSIVNSFLIRSKMFDNLLVLLCSYRHHSPQSGIWGKSGQQRPELIPCYCFKFFCPDTKPVLRQKTGNNQIPVFKEIIVRVYFSPCASDVGPVISSIAACTSTIQSVTPSFISSIIFLVFSGKTKL